MFMINVGQGKCMLIFVVRNFFHQNFFFAEIFFAGKTQEKLEKATCMAEFFEESKSIPNC